ncbi:hypothetical protein SAMN04487760_10482 [Lachnospiraceae bacterium G41]|nr:hypothetical protein SAMN04487760_10482 [Lachnospiraceae bacterium G41]
MIGSKQHIDFIMEYISAYEKKIKLANKNGLFNEAHLFELFAQEICKLWYGQDFRNLNEIKKNYPCVDLLSADGTIYVQVSTQEKIFDKVKNTLKTLDENKYPELEKISTPVFFVLSYVSESSVKDLIGEKQIGKYPFYAETNLISTSKIVQRAKNDVDFQKALYILLKNDVEDVETLSEKLLSIFDNSKSVGLFNINTKINDEYEIDRTNLVNIVRNDDCKFKVISGEAGSGKSVICKKVVESEPKVFFLRADSFANCRSIDGIWDISISRVFNYLKGEKVVIYVDALEYISNASESTKNILHSLLNEIHKYTNVYFIASCRSCDMSAFIKVFSLFDFKNFSVDMISEIELKDICRKYTIIKEMSESKKYAELIRSPFYINEIISKEISLTEAADVNSFRSFIWKECICINKKALEKGIPTNDVVRAVEFLALERSKRFSVGIFVEEIDSKILDLLRSNNVVTEKDDYIRLKYDIYEDICFEKMFDKEFDACKGVYKTFFTNIEKMGNGVYRRYQIWISNKLLAKENRDKFLYALVFGNDTSDDWHRSTLVGLIKSPFCKCFFDEQGLKLIEKNLISVFLELTNCFAFEMDGYSFNKIESIGSLKLKGVGFGRLALIKLIFENQLFKDDLLNKNSVVKICKDYSLLSKHVNDFDEYVFNIITYYVEEYLKEAMDDFSKTTDNIHQLLKIIYSLSNIAHLWINEFWKKLINIYLGEDNRKSRLAEEILTWTLDNLTEVLINEEVEGLLDIALKLWTSKKESDKQKHIIYGTELNDDYLWGIYGAGENYNYSHSKVEDDYFLRLLFFRKFNIAFEWMITIINQMVSNYSSHEPNDLLDVVLFDCDEKKEKKFLGSGRMWFAGREENVLPDLIGDLVYWAKESAIKILHAYENDSEFFQNFAVYIKNQIINESTNIIPFVIIEELGFEFPDKLPGYALSLISSMDIIFWDVNWEVTNTTSLAKEILEKQIKMAMGVPNFAGRYPKRKYKFKSLQQYMAWSQLNGNNKAKEYCAKVLDYLYEKIDDSDAHVLLQVQKMDMRNAKIKLYGEGILSIEPNLSEETQIIVDEYEANNSQEKTIFQILDNILRDKESTIEPILEGIDYINQLMESPEESIKYESYYIMFLCLALKNDNLSKARRSELVCDWIDRIENIFSYMAGYVADIDLSFVLFEQLWNDIDKTASNRLKKFILLCLIDKSYNGQVNKLKKYILDFLYNKKSTARIYFNTILAISEDEWKHTTYNQKVISQNKKKNYIISGEKGVPKPDDIVYALGKKLYKSKREDIINKYLFEEKELDIKKLDIHKMDKGYLFNATNTGLHLDDEDFNYFIKRMMPLLVNSMREEEARFSMMHYYDRLSVKEMFIREIDKEKGNYKMVIDLLFEDSLIDGLCRESIKMYLSIFGYIASWYFDAYEDKPKRKYCCECIKYIEEKIKIIKDPYTKNQLEKTFFFGAENKVGDWNKCKTHYDYEDKIFIRELWTKYFVNHETDVIYALYQMKMGELLPEILPVISKTIDSIRNRGEVFSEECKLIIETFILKAFLDFSESIKADMEFHNSYESILNNLIYYGDEKAAVILDEYRTH